MKPLVYWSTCCLLAGVIIWPLSAIGLCGLAIAAASAVLGGTGAALRGLVWLVVAPIRALALGAAWAASAGVRRLAR